MGDFNCPTIDYKGFLRRGGDAFDTEFHENTLDLMLVQNAFDYGYTRVRSGYIPSKLDYVFTDEDHLIESVNHDAPLGKKQPCSPHLEFNR